MYRRTNPVVCSGGPTNPGKGTRGWVEEGAQTVWGGRRIIPTSPRIRGDIRYFFRLSGWTTVISATATTTAATTTCYYYV